MGAVSHFSDGHFFGEGIGEDGFALLVVGSDEAV